MKNLLLVILKINNVHIKLSEDCKKVYHENKYSCYPNHVFPFTFSKITIVTGFFFFFLMLNIIFSSGCLPLRRFLVLYWAGALTLRRSLLIKSDCLVTLETLGKQGQIPCVRSLRKIMLLVVLFKIKWPWKKFWGSFSFWKGTRLWTWI